jgi:hypothetical protein
VLQVHRLQHFFMVLTMLRLYVVVYYDIPIFVS